MPCLALITNLSYCPVIRANGMLALTERNVKSDGIHVTLSKVDEQTGQMLLFNMTDELRFGSYEVRSIKPCSCLCLQDHRKRTPG